MINRSWAYYYHFHSTHHSRARVGGTHQQAQGYRVLYYIISANAIKRERLISTILLTPACRHFRCAILQSHWQRLSEVSLFQGVKMTCTCTVCVRSEHAVATCNELPTERWNNVATSGEGDSAQNITFRGSKIAVCREPTQKPIEA